MSGRFKRQLSLVIAHLIIKRFGEGKSPLTVVEISHNLQVPFRMVYRITRDMIDAGIISEISLDNSSDTGLQPAQDSDRLTIQFVLEALETKGFDKIELEHIEDSKKLFETLESFKKLIEGSVGNKLLKDI